MILIFKEIVFVLFGLGLRQTLKFVLVRIFFLSFCTPQLLDRNRVEIGEKLDVVKRTVAIFFFFKVHKSVDPRLQYSRTENKDEI